MSDWYRPVWEEKINVLSGISKTSRPFTGVNFSINYLTNYGRDVAGWQGRAGGSGCEEKREDEMMV